MILLEETQKLIQIEIEKLKTYYACSGWGRRTILTSFQNAATTGKLCTLVREEGQNECYKVDSARDCRIFFYERTREREREREKRNITLGTSIIRM